MRAFVIKWGIPAVAFILPWQMRWIFYETLLGGQPFDFGVLSLYAVELLLALVVLLSGRPRWSHESRRPAMLALFVVMAGLASVMVALNQLLALVALMHLAFAMIFFFALLDQRVQVQRVIIAFCAGLVVPCLLGLWQIIAGGSGASTLLGLATRDSARLGEAVFELSGGTRVERAYGSFGHPNIFGGYLAVGIFSLIYLWSQLKERSDQLLIKSGLVLFILTLAATFSRSAILGLFGGLAVFSVKTKIVRSYQKCFLFLTLVATLIIIFFWPIISSRFDFSSANESRSINERVAQYQDFPSVVFDHWLTGQGIGNYTLAVHETFPDRQWWEYQPIHNVTLLIIGEIGLLGLVCVLLWIISIVRLYVARFPDQSTSFSLASLSVIFVISIFDHYLWSLWSGLVLVAFIVAISLRLSEKNEVQN